MISNIAFLSRQRTAKARCSRGGPGNEMQQWSVVIGLPLVGLLALVFLLSLGGAFAFIGPWVIYAGIKIVTKQLAKQDDLPSLS